MPAESQIKRAPYQRDSSNKEILRQSHNRHVSITSEIIHVGIMSENEGIDDQPSVEMKVLNHTIIGTKTMMRKHEGGMARHSMTHDIIQTRQNHETLAWEESKEVHKSQHQNSANNYNLPAD